jgi:hypothetical protein
VIFRITLHNKNVVVMLYLIVSELHPVHRLMGVTSSMFVNFMQLILRRITTQ